MDQAALYRAMKALRLVLHMLSEGAVLLALRKIWRKKIKEKYGGSGIWLSDYCAEDLNLNP